MKLLYHSIFRVLSSRPGYTWAWCRQRRGAWLCPRRRWGWSRHSRSAAPWGTCPLAGLLVCLLWGCCRQHRGWACHHPGRGECSCQFLGVIDLTHWSFTSCVARYIFLIKYFFNAQYCKRHLSPSNTGWDPSEQEGVEPSAHCLPRPHGQHDPDHGCWGLVSVWSGEGARARVI